MKLRLFPRLSLLVAVVLPVQNLPRPMDAAVMGERRSLYQTQHEA